MTRIIGGTAGGRRLATPKGLDTRPTSDRVREALFSAIESWCGSWHGLKVLDLYAGTGAIGLEALSRGASTATFVEQDRKVADLISSNAKTLDMAVKVVAGSVASVLAQTSSVRHHVVFLDPPYPMPNDEVAANLQALVAHGWLEDEALVVVERGKRGGLPPWPEGIEPGRERRYGETVLYFGHALPVSSGADQTAAGE